MQDAELARSASFYLVNTVRSVSAVASLLVVPTAVLSIDTAPFLVSSTKIRLNAPPA
jgi:hypothetical protein